MWRSNFLYNLTSQFLQKLSVNSSDPPSRTGNSRGGVKTPGLSDEDISSKG